MGERVVFLDVDGVLNCRETKERVGGHGLSIGVEERKVEILASIVKRTGAIIVLTSSWKHGWEKDKTRQKNRYADYLDEELAKKGLTIEDKTAPDGSARGRGIVEWMSERNIESFAILDDELFDYEEEGLLNRVVKTTFYGSDGGLREDHEEKAVRLLLTGCENE